MLAFPSTRITFLLLKIARLVCIGGVILLSGCARQHDKAPASPPAGRIAFVSERAPAGVYSINANGSDLVYLAGNPSGGRGPVWSPDGTKFALDSMINGVFTIIVYSADGANSHILHKGTSPAWSPDSTLITFVYYPEDNSEIYTIRVDGSELTRLTASPSEDWSPVWSPDGLHIAFFSTEDSPITENTDSGIYIINADGTGNLRRLAQSRGYPAWSPDGQKIAFCTDGKLYVIGKDGSTLETLAGNANVSTPAWSPDGTRIVYECFGRDTILPDLCIVDASGQNMKRLTRFPKSELSPSWSPDGKWIAFTAMNPHFDIYITSSDGSTQINLTDDAVSDGHPAWMP